MKRVLFVFLFLIVSIRAWSWHIVGGHLELLHVSGYTYRLNLILYLDRKQQINDRENPYESVKIYRNGDNQLIKNVRLYKENKNFVQYTNQECQHGDGSKTLRLLYSKVITLDRASFSDPRGYYAAWQKCCRNNAIINLPDVAPGFSLDRSGTGITLVTDFSPIVKNGQAFTNSSPQDFKPLRDYACVGQPYYADISGKDADGDELRYYLEEPFDARNRRALVNIRGQIRRRNTYTNPAKPYHKLWYGPRVRYERGASIRLGAPEISARHIIPGMPLSNSLKITRRGGLLTVTPKASGLYVFSVRVDEYRNGEKIGTVKRDFQLLVKSDCRPATPPRVTIYRQDGTLYRPGIDKINTSTKGGNICLRVVVRDVEGEQIRLSAQGVGFSTSHLAHIFRNLTGVIPFRNDFSTSRYNTLTFNVCLPPCAYTSGKPYALNIIASDSGCPLPARGIAPVAFDVESSKLHITASASSPIRKNIKDRFTPFMVTATSSRGELIKLSAKEKRHALESVGATFRAQEGKGRVQSRFNMDLSCRRQNIKRDTKYTFYFTAESKSQAAGCPSQKKVVAVDLEVKVPLNTKPKFENALQHTLTVGRGQQHFDVIASDVNNDRITLRLLPDSLAPTKNFTFTTARGRGRVNGTLYWNPDCSLLGDKQEAKNYALRFSATDDNCPNIKADTVTMHFKVQDLAVTYDRFNPPNAFTPNGDHYNDIYKLTE